MTNIYIVTGGRRFGDISDGAMTGSAEYRQRYLEYKWFMQTIYDFFVDHSNDGGNDIKFVFGDATGVDTNAKAFCEKFFIPFQEYEADWDTHHKAAGPIRNQFMFDDNVDNVVGLLAFPGNNGTANMIEVVETYNQKNPENAKSIHKFIFD